MSNEKPVELTEAERAALMHHIGGWKFERQGLANAEDAFMAEVARIVAAREAAARREALLEAAEEHRAEVERLTKSVGAFSAARDAAKKGWQETKDQVARVEALATAFEDAARTFDDGEPNSAAWCRHAATSIRAALAEPERDEESGR